jgi:hypothetical protein
MMEEAAVRTEVAARSRGAAAERMLGAALLVVGAALLYLVLFDQGQVLDVLFGDGVARLNYLHEFFHDGRHLANVPCH